MKFNLSIKLFFALFASILLQNQIQGKPYGEPQVLDETGQWFTKEERLSDQASQNQTSGVRGKRNAAYRDVNMTFFCQQPHFPPSAYSKPCVKGRYFCMGYQEYVCQSNNFECLSVVPQKGYPKCTDEVIYRKIDLGSKGKVNLKITVGCKCAN